MKAPAKPGHAIQADATSLQDVFENIIAKNRWNSSESASGPGSTLAYTAQLRPRLEALVEHYRIDKFFDAPCGDFNWMQHVRFPAAVTYLGGDIVPALVQANQAAFGNDRRRFIAFNLVADPFPDADIWFCRDCLFHLPTASIFAALERFCASSIELLLLTSHVNTTGFANTDCPAGEFRLIDFFRAPFNFPTDVLERIDEYVAPFPPRQMCLWTRAQVRAALDGSPSDERQT